eukprot:376446-Pyramimonas_sp.AAC.1
MHPDACSRLPCLLFLDFGSAFPSLLQSFLWAVLERCGYPTGLLQFAQATYAFAMSRTAVL